MNSAQRSVSGTDLSVPEIGVLAVTIELEQNRQQDAFDHDRASHVARHHFVDLGQEVLPKIGDAQRGE